MNRWLAALPLIALLGLGALFGFYALNRNPQVQPQALVGKPAPTLSLPTLKEGTPTSVPQAAAAGPIIVNFFASWCAPCEIENPVLMTLKGDKVRVVGVAYKDAPQNTTGFLNRLGDPYTEVLVDRDGRAGVEFGVTGVPETYVVAADGRILAKHTGPLTEADAAKLAAMVR